MVKGRICVLVLVVCLQGVYGLQTWLRYERYGSVKRYAAEKAPKKFPTIQELMKATEDRLREGKLEEEREQASRKKPITDTTGSSSLTTSSAKVVAVVLGKALCEGRLSIEHASRISALVRALKKTPLKPSLIVFASALHTKHDVSVVPSHAANDAPAAVSYFYHLCEATGVEPPPPERIWLSAPLTTRDAMRKFLQRVRSMTTNTRKHRQAKSELMSSAAVAPPPPDEYHLLVFAADYVTRRLDRVFRVSPGLSLLTTVSERGESFSFEAVSYPPGVLILEPADVFLARLHLLIDSLVPLLINIHAVVNKEEFLAREYYDDLLDTKQAIAKHLEFIESPLRPAALRLQTSASLTAKQLLSSSSGRYDDDDFYALRQSNSLSDAFSTLPPEDEDEEHDPALNDSVDSASIALTTGGLRRQDQQGQASRRRDSVRARAASTASEVQPPRRRNSPLLDEALESVLSLLNELERLIRPAALRTDSLTIEEWRKALRLLQRAMHQARLATDPDRPLAAKDWGRLVDRDPVPIFDADLADAGWTEGWTEWNTKADSPIADVSTLYRPPGGAMPFDDLHS